MNPWIERGAIWQDFHDSFLPAAREALNAEILPRYFALIQEHVFVDDFDGESHLIGIADVSVSDPGLETAVHQRVGGLFKHCRLLLVTLNQ